jgi:hypothetical protein
VNRVVFLRIVELVGVISDGAGSFPCFTETQYGTGAAVSGIGGDIDVRRLVFIINYGETVSAKDQAFEVWCSVVHRGNTLSHSFVVRGVRTLVVYSASASRKVATYLVRRSCCWLWPGGDAVSLPWVRLDPGAQDDVPKEAQFGGE